MAKRAAKSTAKAIESAKNEAVDAVIRFAARHTDSEVALMGAFLDTADDNLESHALYALREVSRVAAHRFDTLVDCANDGDVVRSSSAAVKDVDDAIEAMTALRALLAQEATRRAAKSST